MIFFLKKFWDRFFSARRPFKLTPAGWVFILYTTGIGAGAINTGNNLLYLIFGVFLGLIIASGVLSDSSLWRVSAAVKFPRSGQAGELIPILLQLTNLKKRIPSLSVSVEMEGDLNQEPITLKVFVPSLDPRESVDRQFLFSPLNRGWFQMRALKLYTRFPFGLLRKRWTLIPFEEEAFNPERGLFVYPIPVSMEEREFFQLAAGAEVARPYNHKGEGASILGIKEYRPGDNPKRIHWKATAKRGGLERGNLPGWLVREMESDQKNEVSLLWPDEEEAKNLNLAGWENFIRFTAALLKKFEGQGTHVSFYVPHFGARRLSDGVYQVGGSSQTGRDEAIWEYLSLFNSSDPENNRVLGYLKKISSEDLRPRLNDRFNLFEVFRAWSQTHEAV